MSPFAAGQQGARLQKAKSDYGKMMANRQPGGSSSVSSQGKKDAFVQAQRQKFFDNRPDVSEDRIFRRTAQDTGERQFKDRFTKPVIGSSNLLQMTADAPRSLAAERERLANIYGPTPSEIFGDIGYGLGNIAKGFGDFISKGGVIGNVISDVYNRFKGGAQEGIETVKNLYDNLRTTLSGQPTVVTGGGSTMVTTSDGQPRIDLTPTSIATETLPAMNLNRNIGDESDPSIFGITNTGVALPFLRSTVDNPNLINVLPQGGGYLPEGFSNVGIENPLFRDINYDPIKINNMDMSGVNNLQLAEINPQQRNMLDQYLFDKMIQEEINRNKQQNINRDMQMFQTNPVNQPVLFAKNGGSVDKYAGLGYKLK